MNTTQTYRDFVLEHLPPHGRVCIVGAGNGDDARVLATKGYEVTAIHFTDSTGRKAEADGPDAAHVLVMESYDFSFVDRMEQEFADAQAATVEAGLTVHHLLDDVNDGVGYLDFAMNLPVKDTSADVLLVPTGLHVYHQELTRQLIEELARVVVPGGMVLAQFRHKTTKELEGYERVEPGVYRDPTSGVRTYTVVPESLALVCDGLFRVEETLVITQSQRNPKYTDQFLRVRLTRLSA